MNISVNWPRTFMFNDGDFPGQSVTEGPKDFPFVRKTFMFTESDFPDNQSLMDLQIFPTFFKCGIH